MANILTNGMLRRYIKHSLITIGLETIALAGNLTRRPAAGRGIIFTLHHVRPHIAHGFAPNALLSITPEFLEAAIVEGKRCGYEPIHLDDIPAFLATPDDGRRVMAFTLDDGYRNNATCAAPVFRRHQVPYTVFVTKGISARTSTIWWETAERLTREVSSFSFDFGQGAQTVACGTVGEKYEAFLRLAIYVSETDEDRAVAQIDNVARANGIDPVALVDDLVMDVAELTELSRDPLCRLGAHAVTHCNLMRVPCERLEREVAESIAALEEWTGKRPTTFAYPYGWQTAFGTREARAVAAAGIPLAVTTRAGVLTADSLRQVTTLPRVSLNGHFQKPRYVRALMSGIPFRLHRLIRPLRNGEDATVPPEMALA